MGQKCLRQTSVFMLLISVAFSFCLVREANGYLNCSEECGSELRFSLKACEGCDTYVEEYMCKHGAYMQYGACMGVCNTLGRVSHWLGYYPPGIVYYEPAEIVKIGFERCDSTGFLGDQGFITDVEIYIIACEDIDTTVDLTSMPFGLLGSAVFNNETSIWELDWNTGSYDLPGGYLIMARYLDPEIEGGEGFGMALAMIPSQRVPFLGKYGFIALLILVILSGITAYHIRFMNKQKECS